MEVAERGPELAVPERAHGVEPRGAEHLPDADPAEEAPGGADGVPDDVLAAAVGDGARGVGDVAAGEEQVLVAEHLPGEGGGCDDDAELGAEADREDGAVPGGEAREVGVQLRVQRRQAAHERQAPRPRREVVGGVAAAAQGGDVEVRRRGGGGQEERERVSGVHGQRRSTRLRCFRLPGETEAGS